MVKKHRYGIEVTPASRARLFHAVIVGALGTFVLFGLYMSGEYLVDMHRENRALLTTRSALMNAVHDKDAEIADLESRNEELLDERNVYKSRLNLFHLDGEINNLTYEPGDESAAQPLEWEPQN